MPRSYIIKQENGRIIRRNLYNLRPSKNKFVQKSCNMAYYWDDSTNNVTEGIDETQNAENEGIQEVRAQVNQVTQEVVGLWNHLKDIALKGYDFVLIIL